MTALAIDRKELSLLCRQWRVKRLDVFGSVLRPDFRPDSDVDVLVSFEDSAGWDLFDLVEFREELERIFGCKVDLVEEQALVNPIRRKAILEAKVVLYKADESKLQTSSG